MKRPSIDDDTLAATNEHLLKEALQECLGALADIALANDMTAAQRRHKARRIYYKWVYLTLEGEKEGEKHDASATKIRGA